MLTAFLCVLFAAGGFIAGYIAGDLVNRTDLDDLEE